MFKWYNLIQISFSFSSCFYNDITVIVFDSFLFHDHLIIVIYISIAMSPVVLPDYHPVIIDVPGSLSDDNSISIPVSAGIPYIPRCAAGRYEKYCQYQYKCYNKPFHMHNFRFHILKEAKLMCR